jgi:hypothetical protein
MGPILVCDKSALHGLSMAELNQLRRNYSLNIPPVLLMEILADLKKAEDLTASRAEVQRLANKLVPACSAVNVGFRDLVFSEIRGRKITTDGRPILQAGECVVSQGQKGMVMEQSAYDEALLRWQEGSFLDAEELLAQKWRRNSKIIDLEEFDFVVRKHNVRISGPCICGSEKLFKDCCGREIVAELAKQTLGRS